MQNQNNVCLWYFKVNVSCLSYTFLSIIRALIRRNSDKDGISPQSSQKKFSWIFKHLVYQRKLGQCTIFCIFPVLKILSITLGNPSKKYRCSQVKRKQSVFSAQGSFLYFQREQEVKNCNYQNYQVQGKKKIPQTPAFFFSPPQYQDQRCKCHQETLMDT